jgi:hypothetical protein
MNFTCVVFSFDRFVLSSLDLRSFVLENFVYDVSRCCYLLWRWVKHFTFSRTVYFWASIYLLTQLGLYSQFCHSVCVLKLLASIVRLKLTYFFQLNRIVCVEARHFNFLFDGLKLSFPHLLR